jgi:toxin ParE1/3/4
MSLTHRYVVRWTPEAESDAAAIVDWFDDLINADKVIEQFSQKAEMLSVFPGRGRIVPELRSIGVLQYHEVFHKPWRMIYSIRDREVWIVAVVDGRRALQDLLFERLSCSNDLK